MDYVDLLKGLVFIDTTVPPGRNYERAIDYLAPFFRDAGLETRKVAIPREHADGAEGRFALLAHRRSIGKPRLIFYGHVDVVPAEGWDAFTPRVEGGKLFGRGAADMKGGIAALLLALDRVKGKPLACDISVMVTTDEEVGQGGQIRFLGPMIEPLEGAHLFDLDSDFGAVSIAALGLINMEVIVKGKSVHSGLAHLGENAVENAALLMAALLELKRKVVQRRSRVDADPSTGLTKMETRLNINMVRGGLKVNIVPDECVISIDRRLIPEENLQDAEKELLDAMSAVRGVRWEVGKVFRILTVPPLDDPVVGRLADIIAGVVGRSGRYGGMGSGDFGPIVSLEWKAKHFGSGVIRPECNIHGKEEFVYLKDIEDLAEVIARFVVWP